MEKARSCPNINSKEFRLLESKMSNSANAGFDAYKIWKDNGGEYPDYILSEANPEVILETETPPPTDSQLFNKQRVIEKASLIAQKKLEKLIELGAKEEHIAEYNQLVKNLNELNSDYAIIEFIKSSQRMISSAEHQLENIKKDVSKGKEWAIKGIYSIKEYIGVLNILKEIDKEAIQAPEFKDLKPLLESLISRQNDVIVRASEVYREVAANNMMGSYNKVEALYRRKAEKDFNSSIEGTSLKGTERAKAKKVYIENYINDNKTEILIKTKDILKNMFIRIEDISGISSYVSTPSDINNYIMQYAVNIIDAAEFKVNKRLNSAAETLDTLYKEYTSYMGGKKGKMSDLYAPLLEKDRTTKELTGSYVNPVSSPEQYKELKQGKYKGTPVEKLYDHIIELQKEKDSSVPHSSKLGYRLPNINKNLLERVYNEDVLKETGSGILDKFRMTSSDVESGDLDLKEKEESQKRDKTIRVITNEAGQERRTIPVHYRGKFDAKKQSYDVLGLTMLDLHNTVNYKEKQLVSMEFDLISDDVAQAQVLQRDYKGYLKVGVDKNGKESPALAKGVDSNLYKNILDLQRHRLFGVSVEGDPTWIKRINNIRNYTSHLNLTLNYLSAGANFFQGTAMIWIESIGGNTGSFGRTDRIHGYAQYTKDLPNIVADISKNIPTSKTNLLAREFQISKIFNPQEKKFIEDNLIKKVGPTGVGRFLDNIGQNHLDVILMYSVMNNIKALNKNGEFLDKNFKPTTDRSKAIGLDSAYEVKEGKLVLNPLVDRTERTKGFKDEDNLKINKYITKIGRSEFGNTDPSEKSRFQRTIVGHLAMQMRGWLVPGFERRYKGMGKVGTKSEDLELGQLDYNSELESFEEGHYTTAVRFLATITKEMKALRIQAIPENWNKLTDYEKSNIQKTTAEVGLIIGMILLASFLKGKLKDDDDNFPLLLATYYSRRLYSESFTYLNPKEGLRTLKSPAIILGTIEDIIEVGQQLVDPGEEYATGDRKGELKIKYRFKDAFGVGFKGTDKNIKRSLLFLEK